MQLRNRRTLASTVVCVLALVTAAANPAQGTGAQVSIVDIAPPNIVFVLTDDLAWNLVQYMPQVQKLQQDGVTFTNYAVTDSLCCPSRTSILTGKFPHDSGVFTNGGSDGGYATFNSMGNEPLTFGVQLQALGYATGFMGKYLNGYQPADLHVPPGWTQWDVAGNGYPEYNYDLNENNTIVSYGSDPSDYLTNVLSRKGVAFINQQAGAHKPFLLELATFAPHSPFTPANQDLDKFPGLTSPRTPAYDTLPTNAPSWLAGNSALTQAEKDTMDTNFRKRAQAVQAVDRLIGNIRAALANNAISGNTYVVFSSDNGFHMGEYRLTSGKQTAFDTDVRVPLIVAGPGVPPASVRNEIVENIDLNPTFQRWAGGTVGSAVDGRSLHTLAHGDAAPDWRTGALVEHHGPNTLADDPDLQTVRNGNPTTYEALRTAAYTYVEYSNGDREFYDRTADPYQLTNAYAQLPAARKVALHDALSGLKNCHNHDACWTAGHVTA